jgi:hypothetical protein
LKKIVETSHVEGLWRALAMKKRECLEDTVIVVEPVHWEPGGKPRTACIDSFGERICKR